MKLSLIATTVVVAAVSHIASAADLTVRVEGQAKGTLYMALYDKEAAWTTRNDPVRVLRAEYQDGYSTVFKDLPAGQYAIGLFVDENGNAKLDTNPAGMPLEKYGVSRDAVGNMGPAKFIDASFEFSADAETVIHLR